MATLNDKFNLAMAFKKGQQRDKKSDIRVEQKLRKITGTATSDSKDGKVMVRLSEGDAVEMSTITSVKDGDTVSVIISNGIPTVQGVIGWGDSMQKQADETRAEVDDHEKLIADVKQDVADYKSTASATYATKTEVDDKTGAITKTLTADYTKTADLASTDAVKDAKGAGTTAQSQLSAYKNSNDAAVAAAKKSGDDAAAALADYKGVVTETYAEKTELTEAVNQLSSTMTSNYSAFTDYRTSNDAALAKAQSDATNAQNTIDGYKTSNDKAVADAKAAGTTAQNQLSAYKGTNDQAVADAKAAGTAAQSNLDSYKDATDKRLDELKNIADNAIESWYLEGAPTTGNEPASEWTTDALKKQHAGDLYMDTDTGYSYRWSGTAWVQVKDSDITKALKEVETVKTTYATKSELSATDTELRGEVSDSLTTAKSYTDSSIATEVTNRDAAIKAKTDSISLEVSKTYTKAETFSAYQSDADSRIATANSNASTAKTTAQTAASDAATAKTQSSTAVSTANTASSNASKAVTTANTASSNASAAVSTANGAKTTASQAVSTANGAATTANAAKSTADKAQETAADAYRRTLHIEISSAPADAAGDTSTLTATVWRGGEQLTEEDVAKLGIVCWLVNGVRKATGYTHTAAAGASVECRLEG